MEGLGVDPSYPVPPRGSSIEGDPKGAASPIHWKTRLAVPALAAGAIVPVLAVGGASGLLDPVLSDLPVATFALGASFLRMLLAYAMSLGFALVYGWACAATHAGERVLLPILDILQSIPILGFFPVAITVFVAIGPFVGTNFAAIFLIFTSMSWNMAFGVYESLKVIPGDMHEATEAFGLRGRLRLTKVLLPATANRLVYNSILSWTAGWYFLVACEVFSANNHSHVLFGIGSYLLHAAAVGGTQGNAELISGVLVLVLLIALLDLLLWRNLSRWAERFRYDTTPSGEADTTEGGLGQGAARRVRAIARGMSSGVAIVSAPVRRLGTATVGRILHRPRARPGKGLSALQRTLVYYLVVGPALVIGWFILIYLGATIFGIFSQPLSPSSLQTIDTLPLALLYSFSRVGGAYLLSLGASLGLAILLVRRPKVARVGLPVVQIVASVPATALFPLFLFSLKDRIGTESAVIFVEMTGMIWYLFFNILSGLRSIPPDLEESAKSAGLKGWDYYRRLVLPGIFSAFVTGSITAFGGGWNTLIIAEYLTAGPKTISVLGLGQLIDISTVVTPNNVVLAAALLTMVVAVITVNEVLWKPLYRIAREKYRYD